MEACFRQSGQAGMFFGTLVALTAPARAHMLSSPQIRDGLAGRISRTTHLHYLAEAYHHVKHTVPLMRLAERRLGSEHAWLRQALGKYIEEEAVHEE